MRMRSTERLSAHDWHRLTAAYQEEPAADRHDSSPAVTGEGDK